MISEMDQAALAKRAAEAFFEAHTVAYAIISNDLIFIDSSDNFVTLFASEKASVRGCPLTDLMYEFVGAEGNLKQLLSGKESIYRLDNVSRLEDFDQTRYFSYTVQPLWPLHPIIGLLLMVEDITQLAELQQELVQERNELRLLRLELDKANFELVQLNEMKSLFLSMAAHDLRVPLTSVFGYADLLLEMENIPEAVEKRALLTIREQAERMHRLIDDLLSLNQVEQDRLLITPKAFDLNEGVEEVVRSLRLIIGRDELTLELDLCQPSLIFWVDPGKLMQILYNLLHNAAKYTPPGGRIVVRSYQDGLEGVFEVWNDGVGLTEEQVGQLFTLYYRTEDAQKGNRAGLGLGLYIVKMLVEAQQGKIDVRSEPSGGTTFSKGTAFVVRLPLAQE